MRMQVAIVYNAPSPSCYDTVGEGKAVIGVLESVESVHRALLELDCQVTRVPLAPPFKRAMEELNSLRTDLVFNLFEGFCGYPKTEAVVPQILSRRGIPYTGCSGLVLRLALDKGKAKVVLKGAGVPTPDFQLLNLETLHMFQLDYPCIVKPCCEDASHGLSQDSIVNNFTALERQVSFVSNTYRGGAIVEEFLDGREFNATVLGNSEYTPLPISEIAYSLPAGMPRVLTFAAKWESDSLYFQGTMVTCPANIEQAGQQRIAATAVSAFRIICGKGYARVDMRMDKEGQVNVIEVNPNPDISPGYGAARQAEAAGMPYTQFIEKIVELALNGKSNENQYSPHDSRRQTQHNENTAPYAGIQTI